MSTIRGCLLPEDLYYVVDRHTWVRPPINGIVQVGITPAGYRLAGGKPVAITVRRKQLGRQVLRGQSVAVMESSKWAGGIPAPLDGLLLVGNPAVEAQPALAVLEPYGAGWIVEMRPDDWEASAASLLTGSAALAAYAALLEREGITCT
jgi:glycine cleavage system H protein